MDLHKEVPTEANPYGVSEGQVWQDRWDVRLTVDSLQYIHTRGRANPFWTACCIREGTGVKVYPSLLSFNGKKHRGYRKVSG